MIVEQTALPEQIGLSSARLRTLESVMESYIERDVIAGAVVLVGRNEQVGYLAAFGHQDVAAAKTMRPNTIFRLASMTKPVISVAVLMLLEEGKLLLTEPVAKYIPAFKGMQVAVRNPAVPGYASSSLPRDGYHLVPAEREITIKDLLTHTSGLGSATAGPGFAVAQDFLQNVSASTTLAELVPRMARTPLSFQPGTAWEYSGMFGFDTLGYLVEVIADQPLGDFLSERIFEPLGMGSTFFLVPVDRLGEVASAYERGSNGKLQPGKPSGVLGLSTVAGARYQSGGGGLAGTAEDYSRFALMLAGGGRLNGNRLLSRRMVALMASNHIGALPIPPFGPDLRGYRFGLGVRVLADAAEANTLCSPGTFGWAGAYGTNSWIDPVTGIVGIMLIQRMPDVEDQELRTLWPRVQTAVYQALDD